MLNMSDTVSAIWLRLFCEVESDPAFEATNRTAQAGDRLSSLAGPFSNHDHRVRICETPACILPPSAHRRKSRWRVHAFKREFVPAYDIQTAVDAENALIMAHSGVLDARTIGSWCRCLMPWQNPTKSLFST
jgi:hypothetical protein